MPVEENVKAKGKIRFFRRMVLLLLVFTVSVLIFTNLGFFNEDNFKRLLAKLDFNVSGNISDNGIIEYTSNKQSRFTVFKGGLVLLTNERLKIYDSTGVELTNTQLVSKSPEVRSNEKLVMVYDRNGYDLRLYNSFTEVFHKKFSGEIINATINKTGYFTVITKAEGYKAQVTVFNPSFEEIYKWSSAESYVTYSDVSPNGSSMAVGIIKNFDGRTSAAVEFFNLNQNSSTAVKKLNGSLVYSLAFKNNDTICALTDSECVYFKPDGTLIAKKSLDTVNPAAYRNDSGRYTVLAVNDTTISMDTKVILLDNNGSEVVNSVVNGQVKSICANSGYIAALTDENAYILNMDGKITDTFKVNRDFSLIFTLDNSHILLIGSNSARYEKF